MNKFSFLLAALCVSLNAQEAKPAETKTAAPAPAPEIKLAGGAKAEQKAYFAEVWVGKSIGLIWMKSVGEKIGRASTTLSTSSQS